MTERVSLKEFWEAIEAQLGSSTIDDLRAIIRIMARDVRPSDRMRFLEKISQEADPEEKLLQSVSGMDLLADIDELVREVRYEMGAADEWGGYDEYSDWEDYYQEEDDLGPYEKFIEAVEVLFDRAQAAFDFSDFSLARKAYEKLFDDLLELGDDYGRGIRIEHLEIDPVETRGRYLRSVYETEPQEQRPKAIFGHLLQTQSLLYSPTPPMLADLIQISQQPLPDRESFLKAWIAYIENIDDSAADAWLREAVRMTEGAPGLEKLARARGLAHPRSYLDWITALKKTEQNREVISAAQEALEILPEGLPIRATIADLLCEAAFDLRERDLLLTGRWYAFHAKPDLARLLDLWETSEPEERVRVAGLAVNYLREYLENPPGRTSISHDWENDGFERPANTGRSVLAHAYLLAHEFERAHELAAQSQVLGWSGSENVQSIVVPYFLVLLSNKTQSELPPNLEDLWQSALSPGHDFFRLEFSSRNERLEQAYETSLSQAYLSPNRQSEILAWCLDISNRRAAAIVSNKFRKSYHKAARITVACGEVLRLRGETTAASRFVSEIKDQFPRHRAFQAELKQALQRR